MQSRIAALAMCASVSHISLNFLLTPYVPNHHPITISAWDIAVDHPRCCHVQPNHHSWERITCIHVGNSVDFRGWDRKIAQARGDVMKSEVMSGYQYLELSKSRKKLDICFWAFFSLTGKLKYLQIISAALVSIESSLPDFILHLTDYQLISLSILFAHSILFPYSL